VFLLLKFFRRRFFIIRIIADEEAHINYPAQSHDPRLKRQQRNGVQIPATKRSLVAYRNTDQHPPRYKCAYRYCHCQSIADITGSIPEARLEIVFLPAFCTTLPACPAYISDDIFLYGFAWVNIVTRDCSADISSLAYSIMNSGFFLFQFSYS
jgi:hypothetical protein